MTTWGGFVNHLRLGVDITTDPYNTYTPSINVYVKWSVQCDPSWNFDDNETLVMTSPQSDSWAFLNTLQANQIVSFTHTIAGQGQSYGGGPTWTVAANLQGVYLGAGPSLAVSYTLPARPYRPPSAPGTPSVSNIQATTATVSWADSTDYGGLTPDQTTLHVATNSSMSNVIQDLVASGNNRTRNLTGLTPGNTYYCQAFEHNGAGWSAGSGVRGFTMLPGASARRSGAFVNAIPEPRRAGAFVGTTNLYKRRNGLWVIQ